MNEAQLQDIGTASRGLFEYALAQQQSDKRLMLPAIGAVTATFASDPEASAELLRRLLDRERLEKFGYLEMPELARVTKTLLEHDAALVRDIYVAAFDFEEQSDEKTHMGGIILPLGSNRRQDYHHAHYLLSEAFPRFLSDAPEKAMAALVAIRRSYARRRSSGVEEEEPVAFRWDEDREARFLPDHSYVWDANGFDHDDEVKILNAFSTRLDELAASEPERLDELIEPLVRVDVPAAIWRRVLVAAERNPGAIVPLILPLLVSTEVMASQDLSSVVGNTLKACYVELDGPTREKVERAVMRLPEYQVATRADLGEEAANELAEHERDRLLGCLDVELLATKLARVRLSELQEADEVPPNRPPISFSGWTGSEYGEREYLAEEGVDVDAPANVALQQLEEPLHQFAQSHQNRSPSHQEIEAIQADLQRLWDAVRAADANGADSKQRDHAWGRAVEVAEAIARAHDITCEMPVVALSREILLASADHPVPVRDPDSDAQFDEFPSWGSPSPRIEAAGGLTSLAFNESCADQEVRDAIKRLSQDEVPAVRYHIAQRLHLLRTTAPNLMWEIADRMATDASRSVTDALVSMLPRISHGDIDRMREVAVAIFANTDPESAGGQRLRDRCVQLLTELYVWRGDEGSGEFLQAEVIAQAKERASEVRQVVLREAQTHGGPEEGHTAIRTRAIGLIHDALRASIAAYEEISAALDGRTDLAEDDPEVKLGREAAQNIDSIASEIYFASGAFKEKQGKETIDPETRERLYREAGEVLDQLAAVPLPSATHHLLETLELFVDFDPRGVFLRIGAAIRGGKAGGYHFDSMAEGLFVRLVERYLADYRTLLRQDDEVRALLIEMLDVFVEAGWPKARQLTYGLHELFR